MDIAITERSSKTSHKPLNKMNNSSPFRSISNNMILDKNARGFLGEKVVETHKNTKDNTIFIQIIC